MALAAAWLAATGALLGCAACGDGDGPTPKPAAHATSDRPSARLVFLTDLQGYLEPCGCNERPLGGIDRAAAKLEALRASGVPMATIAAGDLLFEPGDAHKRQDDKAETQEVWKAETLLDILGRIKLTAALPGPGDLRFGRETFERLAQRAPFPLLRRTADRDRRAHMLELNGLKVFVVGISQLDAAPEGEMEDLAPIVQPLVARAREGGANITVALVQAPARAARRLAGAVKGLDFVVLAGRVSEEATPPGRMGDTTLLTSAKNGRGLLVVDLFRRGQGPYVDVSGWTQDAAQATRKQQIDDLAARIAGWKKDPKVDKRLLAQQEARLARLEREAQSPRSKAPQGSNAFAARFVELGPEAPKHAPITDLMASYDKRVNQHNKKALADWTPEPVPKGQAHYLGSASCAECHESEYAWWQGHPHGKAYTTLTERSKEYNLSCVGCHVTGYLQPGGSTVTHNEGLIHVGCESCHGPGSKHDGDPDEIVLEPEESTCVQCHNEEHSSAFDFKRYSAKLIVPGHGLPLEEK